MSLHAHLHVHVHLHLWRHPKPTGHEGRCIGQTDVPVDRRRAKRLAHRIRAQALRHGWPRVIHTSPLQRCAAVGRILRGWGWRHHTHPAWAELHFGDWDGRAWADIPVDQVDAWVADFSGHRRPGGESLIDLVQRLRTLPALQAPALASADPVLVVAHAGVMQALHWCATQPTGWAGACPDARQWGRAPAYMAPLAVQLPAAAPRSP